MHSGADIPSLYEWLSPALGPVSPVAVAPCTGPRHWWGGQLDVEGLALGSVQAALTAANIACTGERLSTDSRAVAAAFASLDHLRVDGRQPVGFAELSGFFRAADGWVRLHANYPHHARVLVETFGVDSKDALAEQILRLGADLIAERVTAAGGLAVTLRSLDQWRGGDAGMFVDTQPWIRFELGETLGAPLVPGRRLSGVRVLDLTRVIAGPVATRFLALLGADVLRVDPPSNPELVDQYLDMGFGKRSATSDFADAAQRDRIEALLAEADVVISGYRPAALTRYGLDSAALRERFPALSVVTLDAWGDSGPWGDRRGFDSLVQSAIGVGELYGQTDNTGAWRPGALPVQALDHATGYGVAAAALALLARRSQIGAGSAHLCLARTGHLLLDLPRRNGGRQEFTVARESVESSFGTLSFAQPVAFSGGVRLTYRFPPGPYGNDPLSWAP
ncbi:CoA transferase [Mycobacteroides abscessus]|uniref:Probable L-carnitine dehydratase n=1 Tax=Mycobacteroides abscessus subsp. abscessus TaxID=1185650 RepID=A0AB38D4H0_9MYCO|nr:CoA transferase [Mycobacteroides abscessus]AKP57873.1 carnitine dehydratase [Mycobacteroides abscessus UC22]MBE5420054.1 hypothetical protein [Mycobacteroides abscessus]MBE5455247.1 hypothetical protein [Mycobacteroides abscessus]MBN7326477.1 CoA transferase [Mycobacteroides abscessus subsp. abscessus]MBN7334634.1 CoA transferase [Mycobacteroides abscessus subsp. abscessus]